MLASLLFGDYRQKVLARLLLHPEQSHHVREIARLTGTSTGNQSMFRRGTQDRITHAVIF
jgi:hypothetical protein